MITPEICIFTLCTSITAGTALFSWCSRGSIGNFTLTSIYLLLNTCITLAITSLADLADFTLLGPNMDAATGLMLGETISFTVVGVIASRFSRRFPLALAWWVVLSLAITALTGTIIPPAPEPCSFIPELALLLAVLIGFCLLAHCKDNLANNQFLSMLTVFLIVTVVTIQSFNDSLTLNLFAYALFFLCGLLYLIERSAAAVPGRLVAMFMMLIGLSSGIQDILNKGFGLSASFSGIPSLLVCVATIALLWRFRDSIPRLLLISTLVMYATYGIFSILPDDLDTDFSTALLAVLLSYGLICAWHATRHDQKSTSPWSEQLRTACVGFGTLVAISLIGTFFAVTTTILAYNLGPSRIVTYLYNTPLWPGNEAFVRLALADEYLWPGDVQDSPMRPADTRDMETIVSRLVPKHDRYSFAESRNEFEDFECGFENSIGLIYKSAKDSLLVLSVDKETSAYKSGLARGDRIIAVNGKPVAEKRIKNTGSTPSNKLTTLVFLAVSPDGKQRTVTVKRERHQAAPSFSRIIATTAGVRVGYLFFSDFTENQENLLENIFQGFKNAGVRDLVLDVRYNEGGKLTVATTLAGHIAGIRHEGKPFVTNNHIWRYHDRDTCISIPHIVNSLDTRRLVVLTSPGTASASEVLINGLRPYLTVTTVGEKTYGKPFVITPLEVGDTILNLVNGVGLNVKGERIPITGLRPDIFAKDDLLHNVGDPAEGMLKTALEFLEKETTRQN